MGCQQRDVPARQLLQGRNTPSSTAPPCLRAPTSSKKIGIVYSETTAERYFGDPALPGQLDINLTAYSQLFMAAQTQAAMAGVHFDILTEADLTNLAKLVELRRPALPAFQNVKAAPTLGDREHAEDSRRSTTRSSLIASGNFMTS